MAAALLNSLNQFMKKNGAAFTRDEWVKAYAGITSDPEDSDDFQRLGLSPLDSQKQKW